MADRKMTVEDRALRLARRYGADRSTPTGNAYMNGYLAGWHARGRADRLAKAERAVVEAAVDWVEGDCDDMMLIAAIHKLRDERARRKA